MVPGFNLAAVSEHVRIALGKYNNVACRERDSLPVLDIGVSPAVGEQMINDHMPGLRGKVRRHDAGGRRPNFPWSGKLSVEEQSTLKFYGLKDCGEDIHSAPFQNFGFSAKSPGRLVKCNI